MKVTHTQQTSPTDPSEPVKSRGAPKAWKKGIAEEQDSHKGNVVGSLDQRNPRCISFDALHGTAWS